jgi:predicted dehydrogenase
MLRRQFIKNTTISAGGLGLIAATPTELLAALRKHISPNDKIGVGLIGCKGMGWSNLTSMLQMPEITCVALCDIDDGILAGRKTELEKLGQRPVLLKDYRIMLEMKEVDVVIIATPDHWHCLQMIDACKAGKHVYLEKPVSNTIAEAKLMVEASVRYKSLVQVNQWQRSQQHFKDAVAFVQSGKLGKIAQTRAWMYNAHKILAKVENSPVPEGVDYKMWLGPANDRPFNANRFHYNFRWYWDYAGGLMTDWGVHLLDVILWAMKAERPEFVTSMGGHMAYPGDARETPDTQTALYNYPEFQLTWEHTMGRTRGPFQMGHGISFTGTQGTLLVNREGWQVLPDMENSQPKMEGIPLQPRIDRGLDLHTRNFIEALQAGKKEQLNCPIETGAKCAIHCHMGNVAYRSGQLLKVNMDNTFNIEEANRLVKPEYHNGWQWPSI